MGGAHEASVNPDGEDPAATRGVILKLFEEAKSPLSRRRVAETLRMSLSRVGYHVATLEQDGKLGLVGGPATDDEPIELLYRRR